MNCEWCRSEARLCPPVGWTADRRLTNTLVMWCCDVAVVMLQLCFSHINVSTEQQDRQTQTDVGVHRKKEVEIAIQLRALKKTSFILTPLISLDNPNLGRQILPMFYKNFNSLGDSGWRERKESCTISKALPVFMFLKGKIHLENTMTQKQLLFI